MIISERGYIEDKRSECNQVVGFYDEKEGVCLEFMTCPDHIQKTV